MGWHRHGTIKKYFNIGFYEEELQVIEAAYNKRHSSESTAFLRKQSNFIKHCALKKLEIEALELSLREREVSLAHDLKRAKEASWTGAYGAIKMIERPKFEF